MESGITTKTAEIFQDVKLTMGIEDALFLRQIVASTDATDMTTEGIATAKKFIDILDAALNTYEKDFDDEEVYIGEN